jgi:hypothetical protein
MHKKALETLLNLSKEGPLKGIKPTIEYLKEITSKPLILEYSKWVIETDPILGLEIFTRDDISFTNDEVSEFLDKFSGSDLINLNIRVQFLENIVKGSKDSELHNKLILNYLDILKLDIDDKKLKDNTRDKLKLFLQKSSNYAPDKLLSYFSDKGFFFI